MTGLAVQLERPGAGFLELSEEALEGYAESLARAWSTLGIGWGDRVAIYDYGSSPAAYLASQAFAPYLEQGAAERRHAAVLCVDGLPDNVRRFSHVLRHFQPSFAFVRADLVPLLIAGPTAVPAELRTARLVVSADGDTPSAGERDSWQRAWPGGLSLLARCDAAAFTAAQCPRCGLLRVPKDLYETQVICASGAARPAGEQRGMLTVRPRFLDQARHATELIATPRAAAGGCSHEGFELA